MSSESISVPAGVMVITLIAIAAAALLAYTNELTRERIAKNEVMVLLRGLREVLPIGQYDNQPHEDVYFVTAPELLGSEQPLPVYRARAANVPVAAVLTVISPDGYVGQIKLLVAIDMNGRVFAVRAVEHTETPGLGDAIDIDKSNWITQFVGRQLGSEDGARWQVRRDGGEIDHITGATVTSRAVVNAVRDALHYFDLNRDEIFSADAELAAP